MDLCQGDARDSCSSLASCRWPRLLSGELKTWQDAVGYRHIGFFWDVGEGNFYGFSRISQRWKSIIMLEYADGASWFLLVHFLKDFLNDFLDRVGTHFSPVVFLRFG